MNEERKVRLGGLGMIALSLFMAWYFALGPLREAHAGAAEVSYSLKAFLLAPFLLVMGLVALLGGARARAAVENDGRPTPLGIMVAIAGFALAGIGYWWFDAQLDALGYS